jgi:hypothetical protein
MILSHNFSFDILLPMFINIVIHRCWPTLVLYANNLPNLTGIDSQITCCHSKFEYDKKTTTTTKTAKIKHIKSYWNQMQILWELCQNVCQIIFSNCFYSIFHFSRRFIVAVVVVVGFVHRKNRQHIIIYVDIYGDRN